MIDAYIRGLDARAQAGDPIGEIASVASFFLSRIDAKVDPRLPEGSPLRGTVALASARVAYQRYLEKFAGERWERLEGLGAKRQRPLWASTGTKDPRYSDVLYVYKLIGPDVVNTMPDATLRAFGRPRDRRPDPGRRSRRRASTLFHAATAGVDLDTITAELERAGVRSFCDSYDQLLACITSKLDVVRAVDG